MSDTNVKRYAGPISLPAPLIYVAGPLSAATFEEMLANVKAACAIGCKLIALGYRPFVPHLSLFWDDWFPQDYETWMAIDNTILCRCDALYFMGSSPGADREKAAAAALGLPIYESLEAVPRLKEEGKEESPSSSESERVAAAGTDTLARFPHLREFVRARGLI